MTVNVDRTRAQAVGLTQRDVATGLLVALSGSFQTTPSFFLDPRNGVTYNVTTAAPQYGLDSLADLQSLPITGPACHADWPAERREPTGRAWHRWRSPRAQLSSPSGARQSRQYRARRRAGHRDPLRRSMPVIDIFTDVVKAPIWAQ